VIKQIEEQSEMDSLLEINEALPDKEQSAKTKKLLMSYNIPNIKKKQFEPINYKSESALNASINSNQ